MKIKAMFTLPSIPSRTMESYASDRERGVQIPKPDNMARNVPSLG